MTLVKVVTEKGSVIVKSVDFMSGYVSQADVDRVITIIDGKAFDGKQTTMEISA